MNTAILNPKLDHPAYHQSIQLPKYNGKVTVFQATCSRDGAKVLHHANPDWTEADHLTLASLHATESAKQLMRYNVLLEAAAQETYGRPFRATDYRISAIASEEFSEEKKAELRKAAHARTHHDVVARAHLTAARRRKRMQ
ncbi:hypothetical protein WJ97_11615 [Burkholderia ubonensis]|uniref:hypothetical protein n=1 Tax=Burkholderia ubonensis TaxID=101571 RepID=UPI00075C6507|nr:hypothetical protein [Burkholderia ubonensis]KVP65668.1 hypothetical protein WJ93_24420 [Burkholderia ubonensis]KVP96526.1 hypothetical protein WJ97_11615 [Burkholderia ubonensis]